MNDQVTQNRCPKCGGPIPAEASQGVCPKCLLAAVAMPTEAGQPAENRPPPPSVEAVQAALPQLEVLELIGCGGMGAVYRARQPKLDRVVALKVLIPPLAGEGAFAERFHREARLLARLNHPGVVSVYDYGEAGGFFYLMMEFVDGVNLRQAMQAGRFSPAQALALVPKICDALQYAHDEGILHRDIKPENILLDIRGRVKIADFGIAKMLGDKSREAALTASGAAVGTPHYMAPEQLEHPQDVDQRADIYSLGVVFYEMLTGELPIGRFAPPSQKTPMDPRVDEVVLRALAKERERRQQNATEVKQQVETITSGSSASAESGGSGQVVAPPSPGTKTSMCYISTPEYLRTFRGRFLYIYQGKGELRLDRDTLSFHSGWQVVTIPLSSIRSLARGEYPASAKPVPFGYIGVTFEDHGISRTLLFTPAQSALMPVWETNNEAAEWLAALQQAIRAVTGDVMAVSRANVMQASVWADLAKTFLLTSAGCTLAFALIPLILKQRLPDHWSEIVWGPVTAALTLVLLLVVRWWKQRVEKGVDPKTPLTGGSGAKAPPPGGFGPGGTWAMSGNTPPTGEGVPTSATATVPNRDIRATCYFSTPGRMQNCFPAPAARIFMSKGELRLSPDQLIYVSPWQTEILIPLDTIEDLSIGQFQMWTTPWVMKYERVNFLSVTFTDSGSKRTVHLTPVAGEGMRTINRGTQVSEWFEAIKSAVTIRTGRAPHVSDPMSVSVSAEPAWNRKGLPLFFGGMLSYVRALLPSSGEESTVIMKPLHGITTTILWLAALWFTIGFLQANAALKRGDFDAVTSDEPIDEASFASNNALQLPVFYTVSAWLFILFGTTALIETLTSLFQRPFHGSLNLGMAHLFAGIALLTLNRRWRIAALVMLSLACTVGVSIAFMSVMWPAKTHVKWPWSAPFHVHENPQTAAVAVIVLVAMLGWPTWLLLSAKAQVLFGKSAQA